MNHRSILAVLCLALLPADFAAAASPAGAAAPQPTPTPMAVPGAKAPGTVSASPAPKAARAKGGKVVRRSSSARPRHVRRPGKARGSGSHIPARELALPQSAPRYDKKGRYLPTVYIYQQTNGEFRILSPGGGAAAAPPSEEGQPAGGQPAAPGGAPSSGPGKEPGGGNTPFAPEGVPADAPRP